MANSFNDSRYGGEWGGFTLKWYNKLFNDRNVWESFKNTMIIGLSTTVVSVIIGIFAAFVLHRFKSYLQTLHSVLIYIPLAAPDILLGISMLLFFISLKIELGMFTIFLAHITFSISYVTLVLLGRLQDFDYSVIEAAYDLGATKGQTIRRIFLPMMAPGIIAGGLLTFILSVDDFVITFFVSGPGASTLPLYIYSVMRHGSPMTINALTTIFLIVTFFIVIFSKKLLEVNK